MSKKVEKVNENIEKVGEKVEKTRKNAENFNDFEKSKQNCFEQIGCDNKKTEIEKSLFKRAMGYTVDEIVEEYATVDDELKLVKKKITKKHVPPDISAARELLENSKDEFEYLKSLNDNELLELRDKILAEVLKEKP